MGLKHLTNIKTGEPCDMPQHICCGGVIENDWNLPKNICDVFPYSLLKESKTPYICPVCGGKGIVQNGFYSSTGNTWIASTTIPETCRTCGGKGIVWHD